MQKGQRMKPEQRAAIYADAKKLGRLEAAKTHKVSVSTVDRILKANGREPVVRKTSTARIKKRKPLTESAARPTPMQEMIRKELRKFMRENPQEFKKIITDVLTGKI